MFYSSTSLATRSFQLKSNTPPSIKLTQIVRATEQFQKADASERLIKIATGDGMALLFFDNLEQPARCALEISEKLRSSPEIQVRMGIHSGPVNQVPDVNDRVNIAGAGINIAQRVLDCGDAGHILVSKHVADDLKEYRHWRPYLLLSDAYSSHGVIQYGARAKKLRGFWTQKDRW